MYAITLHHDDLKNELKKQAFHVIHKILLSCWQPFSSTLFWLLYRGLGRVELQNRLSIKKILFSNQIIIMQLNSFKIVTLLFKDEISDSLRQGNFVSCKQIQSINICFKPISHLCLFIINPTYFLESLLYISYLWDHRGWIRTFFALFFTFHNPYNKK